MRRVIAAALILLTAAGVVPPAFAADASWNLSNQPANVATRDLVHAFYQNQMLVIVTYDENGGFWPPKGDRWGPRSRIPALVISPRRPGDLTNALNLN